MGYEFVEVESVDEDVGYVVICYVDVGDLLFR